MSMIMPIENHISHADLLSCFFTECERQLRSLENDHGFSLISGLGHVENGRTLITPYKTGETPEEFYAIMRYEQEGSAIEISYSAQDYTITSYVYHGPFLRFSVAEMLQAAKKPFEHAGEQKHLARTDLVKKFIDSFSEILSKHSTFLIAPDEKLIEKVQALRSAHISHALHERQDQAIQMATEKAVKAFAAKDYKKVIMLLTPIESQLAKGDLKKLTKARRFMLPE